MAHLKYAHSSLFFSTVLLKIHLASKQAHSVNPHDHNLFFSQAASKASASLTDVILETHRKKHMAFLMADLGVLVDKETGKQMPRDVRM